MAMVFHSFVRLNSVKRFSALFGVINPIRKEIRMGEFEEFLDQICCQLSASGMHVDRQALKDCLLVPGEGRRPLIQWALSQLDIKVKEEDITEVVIGCGLCSPSKSDIVLGKCSTEDNLEFWKKLFHTVRMYQETRPASSASTYKSISKFWLELAANPELKDVICPQRRKGVLPLKVPKDSANSMSMEELLKEKVIEECKLRELEKEKEAYLPPKDIEELFTWTQDTEDLDKLKHQVDTFKNDVANSMMPWIVDTCQNSELDEYNELIPEVVNKVEKIRRICEDAGNILAALEELSKIKFEELSIDEKLCLPYMRKE